ncbi:hypothetical protein Tco_0084414 [Tanacetum coccineum]
MTHDPPEGVVRFTNGNNEVSYKMPHKIEQYDSLSNLEKEHSKSVYLRNEEDKRRGVKYVMSKILGFYKECLELGPEYLTGVDDEGEVTHDTTIDMHIARPINLGPEGPRVYSDLSQDEKDRYNADIRATNIILQGLPKDIYSLINHYTDAKDIWDNVKMLLEGSELTKEDRESQLYDDFEHFRQNKGETIHDTISCETKQRLEGSNVDQLSAFPESNTKAHANDHKICRNVSVVKESTDRVGNAKPGQARHGYVLQTAMGRPHSKNCTQPNRPQNSEYIKDKMLSDASSKRRRGKERKWGDKMLLMQAQENGVALDEEQLLFIAGGQDNAIDEDVDEQPDAVCEHHEAHEMHHDVQPNYVVDLNADYTSDNHMITYDQYVKDNAESVVQSNVSSVPNDAYMMINNEMHEQTAQSVSTYKQNKVVNVSLTAELATYKDKLNCMRDGPSLN